VPWRFLDAGQLSLRTLLVAGVQKPAQKQRSGPVHSGNTVNQPTVANGTDNVFASMQPSFMGGTMIRALKQKRARDRSFHMQVGLGEVLDNVQNVLEGSHLCSDLD
jgi:hypothetical protein